MSVVVFGDFEWDADKARANLQKHGVSFEEAVSVFSDPDYLLVGDSADPDRYLALGYSSAARMLVVVHCERADRLRIISARTPTTKEAKGYERRE